MSIRRSVSGPAFLLTAGRTLAFGASFFIPVVLARVFSPEEFGTYKQVFILFETLFYIAQAGLVASLFYFLPRSPERAPRYVANAAVAIALIAAVCAVAIASGGDLVSWMLSNASLGPLVLPGSVYFLFLMVAIPLEIVMICRERYRLAAVSYATSDVLRAAALIVPTLLTGDLRWLMAGAVAFAVVRSGAAIAYLRGTFGRELRPDRALFREQLRYSLPFGLAVLVGTLQANLHYFVISHSFDAATFAIFAVGCLQIPLIDFVATPMADVMMVKMTEARRDGDYARARAIWHQASSDLALLFVPLVSLLVVTADELIVFLFTSSYAASVPIFRVSVLTILFTPPLVESVLRVHADTRFILFLNSIQLVVMAILIWPLVERFGLLGGVLVMLIAITVVRVVGLMRIKRLLGTGWRDLLPWGPWARVTAIAAVATAASLGVKAAIDARPVVELILICATHLLVWAALSVRWGFLPMPTVAVVRSLIRHRSPLPATRRVI